MVIKRTTLEALEREQGTLRARFGPDSDMLYAGLSPELKASLKGISPQVIEAGAKVVEDFARKGGDTIE